MTWSDAAAIGALEGAAGASGRPPRKDFPGVLRLELANFPETWATLPRVGRELTGDVRAVVVWIKGDDPVTESAAVVADGYDRAWGALSESECEEVLDGFQSAFRWLRRNDLISIAMLTGAVAGPGVHAALACDVRFFAENSSLAVVETGHGLVPGLTGSARLVELAGLDRALEICLTGRKIGADEAERLGLATRLAPETDLPTTVDAFLAALLALPRDAVVETKALLAGAAGRTRRDQEAAERAAVGRRLRDLAGAGE